MLPISWSQDPEVELLGDQLDEPTGVLWLADSNPFEELLLGHSELRVLVEVEGVQDFQEFAEPEGLGGIAPQVAVDEEGVDEVGVEEQFDLAPEDLAELSLDLTADHHLATVLRFDRDRREDHATHELPEPLELCSLASLCLTVLENPLDHRHEEESQVETLEPPGERICHVTNLPRLQPVFCHEVADE